MLGTRRQTLRPTKRAAPSVPAASCACRRVSRSLGPTKARCESKRTWAVRCACCISIARCAPTAAPSWQGHSVAEWLGVPPPANPFGALVAPTQEAGAARAGRAAAGPPGGRRCPRGTGAYARQPQSCHDESAPRVSAQERCAVQRAAPWSPSTTTGSRCSATTTCRSSRSSTDPAYLTTPFVVSNQFKREPDDSKWNPTPCATDAPLGTFQRPAF